MKTKRGQGIRDSHNTYATNDGVTRPEWMTSICRVCGQWVVPSDTPAAKRPCPGYLVEAPTPAGPYPKHRRRKNGQCYAACPACVKEWRQTERIVNGIFAELGLRTAFMMGFAYGVASLRQPRATYEKLAQSLPPWFRDLAVPPWHKRKSADGTVPIVDTQEAKR